MIEFLAWTLMLYWIHRIVHCAPVLMQWHFHHHAYINQQESKSKWHINNLVLFNDDWPSTFDLWATEVVPTLLFSWITGAWWIAAFYYVWAAFFQELLEHRASFNWYPFTAGKWHLTHHQNPHKNFGLFVPLWDKIFRTEHARA